MAPAMSSDDLKAQGNEQYAAKNYLKAASLYTQALKIDPSNAVLYSNRCIALYHLKKIGKALADAEKACELRPDWEKAHYRRGFCFEEQEKYEDALAAYMTSLELEKNKECAEKVKNIKKLLSKGVKDEPRPDGVKTVEEYRTIQGQLSSGDRKHLPSTHDRVLSFAKTIVAETLALLRRGEDVVPAVTFQPGWTDASGEEPRGQVNLKGAFENPETVSECSQFLQQYAADYEAHAAVLVVPRKALGFPQVWKQKGWTMGNMHGVFIQLESDAARRMWFIPVPKGKPAQEPVVVEDKEQSCDMYRILPHLFRG